MTTENNFRFLIEEVGNAFGLSYGQLKEKYNDFPTWLIEYIDKDDHEEYIEVNFDNRDASIVFFFFDNEEKKCIHSLIYFHHPKDEDSFIRFLSETADHYSYRQHCWVFKILFYVELKQEPDGTQFYCYKL